MLQLLIASLVSQAFIIRECATYSGSPGFKLQNLSAEGLYPHAQVDVTEVVVPSTCFHVTDAQLSAPELQLTGMLFALLGGS